MLRRPGSAQIARLALAVLLVSAPLAADTWTHVKGGHLDPLPGCFRSAVFSGNLLVAVGDSGLCETTTTPMVKSSYVKRNPATTENLYGLAYGNGLFVAVGYHGVIVTSPDGVSWTLRCPFEESGVFPQGRSLIGVCYADGLWVAAGIDGRVKTSPDGITWTERGQAPGGARINALAYRNGTWVAAAGSGYIYYSSNGISWTRASSAPSEGMNLYSALATDSGFVVGGRLGMCLTSTNGTTWTKRLTNTQDYLMSLCDNGTHVVSCGNYDWGGCSQIIASVNDGTTWVRDRTDDTSTLYAIAQGNGYVVAMGNRSLVQANTTADIGDGRGCGVTASLRVVSPNGGEFLKSGTTWTITWDSTAVSDPIRLRYTVDDGADGYDNVIVSTTENDGSYDWVVPRIKSTKCRVKVLAVNENGIPSDTSNATFEIGDTPTVSNLVVTSPATGAVVPAGAPYVIRWSGSKTYELGIDIEYTLNGGTTWTALVSRTADDGAWEWNVPQVSSSQAQLWIKGWSASGNAIYRTGNFTIGNGSVDAISITSPKGGDRLSGGSLEVVTWVGTKTFDTITLRYYDGASWHDIVRDAIDTGSYPWIVPNINTSKAQLVIKGVSGTGEALYKTDYFSIVVSEGIRVLYPMAGDGWVPGFSYNIGWTRQGAMAETVDIRLYKTGGYIMDIATATANDLNEIWTVPAQLAYGEDYQIQVQTTDGKVSGLSNLFGIVPPPTLTVTRPAGSDALVAGTTEAITWAKEGRQSATVVIDLYRAGEKLQTIAASAPNSGTYAWSLPYSLEPGEGYVVRVTTSGGEASDDSDAFRVSPPWITVTSPGYGALWPVGSTQEVAWEKSGAMDDRVRIVLFQNDQQVSVISETTDNNGQFQWQVPADLGGSSMDLSEWDLKNLLPRNSGGNNGLVNDGSPYWTVPLDPSMGGVFTLKVITLDGRVIGVSELFVIAGTTEE